MTSQAITKKDPIRQVAKAAVLGLSFCMSAAGYAKTLLVAMADPKSGITEEVLNKLAAQLGWRMPHGNAVQRILEKLGCTPVVGLAAYHIHRSFNHAHPEFGIVADWLVRAVGSVAGCASKDQASHYLERMHRSTSAPDRNMLDLAIDNDCSFHVPSVRVRCGPWVHTVCWREPRIRAVDPARPSEKTLTILKSTGEIKTFTRQLAIENVTQAAARNMLCWGVAELDRLGFADCLHVHDELLLIGPRTREWTLAARNALSKVFGLHGNSPLGWATLVKDDEISVTCSLWEDEDDLKRPYKDKNGELRGGDRWGRIERNEPGCLDDLP